LNINVQSPFRPPEMTPVLRRVSQLRRELGVIRACLIGLLVIAALFAMVAGASLMAPTAIAVTLALILAPVTRALERLRIPTGVASPLTVIFALGFISLAAVQLAPEASNWLARAPEFAQSLERKLRPITRQLAAVERASNRLAEAASPGTGRSVTVSGDGFLLTAARTAPALIENGVYVAVLTTFLLACRRRYTIQLMLLPRTFRNRLRMARICRDMRHRVSGYLFTLALINIGLAAATTLAFYLAGIRDPILWGFAFGLLNFVPVIGPTTIIIAGAIYGLAVRDTLAGMLAPPMILLALDTVEANFVQPWLLSRRIVISPIAILLTVVTLVWMWGPAAAITAVPTLILVHTIAMHVPALRPVGFLLASENGRLAKHVGQDVELTHRRRRRRPAPTTPA
jgi:predicted PurR-regulated permease PerM